MTFATVQEWKNGLLRPRLVRQDVFIQGLTRDEVAMIDQALERGFTLADLKVIEDTLILRFDRNESRKPLQEE